MKKHAIIRRLGPLRMGLALSLGALALASCGQEPMPTTDESTAGKEGVTITNGRLVLPAVAGNPGAVYMDVSYEGPSVAMIRTVEVTGAKSAMLHQTLGEEYVSKMEEVSQVRVDSGDTLKLEPGSYHVMAMGLDPSLKEGGSTDATVTFVGGDSVTVPLEIRGPGDAG
jgi:copper(I)-binding protein